MTIGFPSNEPEKYLTPEVFGLLIDMIRNPEESWWVQGAALNLIGRASADRIAPHVDLLIPYLKHDEWWLQNAALVALTPVVADERCYRKVVPAIGDLLTTCELFNTVRSPMRGITAKINEGSPEVQRLASEAFEDAYVGFSGAKKAPGGQNITGVYNSQIHLLAETLADVPGGYDVLYETAKQRFPNDPLPYDEIFLSADPEKFGPELRKAIGPIIREKLVYEYSRTTFRPRRLPGELLRPVSFAQRTSHAGRVRPVRPVRNAACRLADARLIVACLPE